MVAFNKARIAIVGFLFLITTTIAGSGGISCPMWCNCEPGQWCYHTPDFNPVDGCEDGVVGITEFLYILANWGACGDIQCLCAPGDDPGQGDPICMCCEWGDINRDHQINVSDLILIIQWWGPLDRDVWAAWRCQDTQTEWSGQFRYEWDTVNNEG